MSIELSCSCGKKLKVRDDLAGKRVKCPACQGVIAVPQPEEEEPPVLEAAPAEEPDETEASDNSRRSEPFWTDPKGFENLVALSDDAIYVAALDEDKLKQARKRSRPAGPVHRCCRATAAPPSCWTMSARWRVTSTSVDVTWRSLKQTRHRDEHWFRRQESRDEFMDLLKTAGACGWKDGTARWSPAACRPAAWLHTTPVGHLLLRHMVATGQDKAAGRRVQRQRSSTRFPGDDELPGARRHTDRDGAARDSMLCGSATASNRRR
jgi:hypothetical protein